MAEVRLGAGERRRVRLVAVALEHRAHPPADRSRIRGRGEDGGEFVVERLVEHRLPAPLAAPANGGFQVSKSGFYVQAGMVAGAVAGNATAPPYPAGMRYRTKREWALAKAREVEASIDALRGDRIESGNWRAIRRKQDAIYRLNREADRWRRIASRLAA